VVDAPRWWQWCDPRVHWRRYQRGFDLAVLWPECARVARSETDALIAFGAHMVLDAAWMKAAPWEMRPAERAMFLRVTEALRAGFAG